MRRTRLLRATLVVAAGLIAALLAACGGRASEPSASELLDAALQRGPHGVGVTTIDLFDRSRPTEQNGDVPGSSERKLTVEVWYPARATAEEPDARDVPLDGGPYPLIIFAHGLSANRRLYPSYTQHLASHGYVVAAPDFPLSNGGAEGGPRIRAALEQPGDVSFVIDSLLDLNEEAGHLLRGSIDHTRIGMSGHSLGALTTMLTIYGPDRDPRISAALPISAVGCFLPDTIAGDASVPLLVLGGTNDTITPPGSSDRAYRFANPPRYLVHLVGADHVRFADVDLSDSELAAAGGLSEIFGSTVASDAMEVTETLGGDISTCGLGASGSDPLLSGGRQRELLRTVAVSFFDAYLRGDKASRDLLLELPDLLPEVRLESDLG